jgi:raffinose/stachyose/melibiose transport system permease protein
LDWNLFSGEKDFVGFENYVKLFRSKEFPIALKNNLWYVGISLVFQVGVALLFAAFLEGVKYRRISTILRTAFFIPSLISFTIIGLLFTFVFRPDGLLNGILRFFGLDELTRGWLGDPSAAIFAVIAVSQWKGIGYTMMFLIVAIQRIPNDLYDAAKIDGASGIKTFTHVTVPQIAGMIRIALIINVSGGLLVFNEIFVMTSGGPHGSSEVLSTLLYQNAFVHGKVGYASSISNIIFVLALIFAVFQYIQPGKKEKALR